MRTTIREALEAELRVMNRAVLYYEARRVRGDLPAAMDVQVVIDALETERLELLELVTAVPRAGLEALADHLRDDARCGGMYEDPVDEYAHGLDCAADQLDEVTGRRGRS